MTRPGLVYVILTATALVVAGCAEQSNLATNNTTAPLSSINGNGAPNGSHYNLNIIGVPRSKTASMDDNSGHRIFVNLDGNTKILLAEGETFAVLDANGTDGNGAKFQLPDPDPDGDLVTSYSVWARALGKPGGWSQTRTAFTDSLGDTYYSLDTLTLVRSTGQQKFVNVSKELLTVYADIDGDGIAETVSLFDDDSYEFFWSYNNFGLRLAQLRFYELPSNVSQ